MHVYKSIKVFFFTLMLSTTLIGMCNREHLANSQPFPQNKPQNALRVMTYNIRWDSPVDQTCENAWNIRKHKIAKIFDYYQPDIIAIEETHDYYVKDLVELCSNYDALFINIIFAQDNSTYKDTAILYNKNRCILQNKDYFLLAPDIFDRSYSPAAPWGCKIARPVIIAKLLDTQNNKEFCVFATHFESLQEDARIYSAQIIAEQAALLELPLVVLGDFNLIHDKGGQEAYSHFFRNNILQDIRDLCQKDRHYGPDGTWIGWSYDQAAVKPNAVGYRLDHILVKDFTVVQEGVLRDKVDDTGSLLLQALDANGILNTQLPYPSDHLPVIADLFESKE